MNEKIISFIWGQLEDNIIFQLCEIIYQPEKPQKHIWGLSKPQVH